MNFNWLCCVTINSLMLRNLLIAFCIVILSSCTPSFLKTVNINETQDKLLELLWKLTFEENESSKYSDGDVSGNDDDFRSPKKIINDVFIRVFGKTSFIQNISHYNTDSIKVIRDYEYKNIITNIMLDISSNNTKLHLDNLIEILPSFLLYSMHNASMFPPLHEGLCQRRERRLPLSYFRDQPMTSPIMDLYKCIIEDILKDIYSSSFDRDIVVLQPMNDYMFDILKRASKTTGINLDKIESITIDESKIFFKNEKSFTNKEWQTIYPLITSSGVPQNNFDAIQSGIKSFLKYKTNNKVQKFSFLKKKKNVKAKLNQLYGNIDKLESPSKNKYHNIYDDMLNYRSEICELIIRLTKNHKFKYIKPFHVKNSQNLMIEIFLPPHAGDDYSAISKNVEHVRGWVNLINGFLCGLINHYANLRGEHTYTILRDSYGFLRPSLALSGTSLRLSMGLQPIGYANIVAKALIDLDKTIENFESINMLNVNGDIFIKDSTGKDVINISESNTNKNITSIISLMQNNKISLFSFLAQKIKNKRQHDHYNYYLNSMIEEAQRGGDLKYSTDHVILSTPIAQQILNNSYKRFNNGLYPTYLVIAFASYLNEMILSRINVLNNGNISLDKTFILKDIAKYHVYYTCGFDKSLQTTSVKKTIESPKVVLCVLENMQFYLKKKLDDIHANRNVQKIKLLNSFCLFLEKTIEDYKKLTFLIKNRNRFNSDYFYNKAVRILETSLEDIGILNSIYYAESEFLKKKISNVFIQKKHNITNGVFLMDWGEQAAIASILWLTDVEKQKEIYLYTDETSYYEVTEFQNILGIKHAKDVVDNNKRKLFIYFIDPVPTIVLNSSNEKFNTNGSLHKIDKILNNTYANGSTIALVIDASSTPMLLQTKIYKDWVASTNDSVKYLIFIVSGNKNSQLGLDRYQFGQISVYIKHEKNDVVNFRILDGISSNSHNPLLNYLRRELEKIQGASLRYGF